MGKIDILKKIEDLILELDSFEERDVVYVLVELYKVKEREMVGRENVLKEFTHLSFYRDWVVHTELNKKAWIEKRGEYENEDMLMETISNFFVENTEVQKTFLEHKESFLSSLKAVTKDQPIKLKD